MRKCVQCGCGASGGGWGVPGVRDRTSRENGRVNDVNEILARVSFAQMGVACVFYKKNVFSTLLGIFYREFFVSLFTSEITH